MYFLLEIKDFGMIAIHTKPTDAVNEVDGLTDVYDGVKDRWGLEVGQRVNNMK